MRVLIVEDELVLALGLETLVAEIGHETAGHAGYATEALRLAIETRPDIALVDLNLFDGFTGVEVARSIAPYCKAVVFMTATPDRVPDDHAGAWGIIAKPVSEAGMIEALHWLADRIEGDVMSAPPPPGALRLRLH